MSQTIFSWATSRSISVWWDQPDHAPSGADYTVTVNDASCQVQHTHYTFDVTPEVTYTVSVCLKDELLGQITVTAQATPQTLNVLDFGAVGDGKTLNTAALQKAFDACPEGAEVVIPAGTYLTGGLRLHSNMNLYLEEGAKIQGTENPEDYLPKIHSRFEGIEQECYQSVLNLGELDYTSGPNCENVLIYGHGSICGGGQPLGLNIIEREKKLLEDFLASLGDKIKEYENAQTVPGRARGRLINMSNCRHIRISGLNLENGASWNVHPIYSQDIVTDHCIFRSEGVWNGDGWDPDSSEDCTLFASEFYTGDDSVAIKSGKNPEGNVINRPTRNIRVFDCISYYGLGVAIGSEMSGGVENVQIWDCDLAHSLSGVQIKATKKRGGFVRNIRVVDTTLPRFLCCAVGYNDDGEGSAIPPKFSDMLIRRVHFTGWCRNYWEKEMHELPFIDLSGFNVPGYECENIRFEQCSSEGNATIVMTGVKNISIDITNVEMDVVRDTTDPFNMNH